jgi:hypothetical protein
MTMITNIKEIARRWGLLLAVLALISACREESFEANNAAAQCPQTTCECDLSSKTIDLLEEQANKRCEGLQSASELLDGMAEELHLINDHLKDHNSNGEEASLKQILHEIKIRLMQISEQLNTKGLPGATHNEFNEAHLKRMAFAALQHEEGTQIMPFLDQIRIHQISESVFNVEIPFKNRGETETTYIGWVSCEVRPEIVCTVDRVEY